MELRDEVEPLTTDDGGGGGEAAHGEFVLDAYRDLARHLHDTVVQQVAVLRWTVLGTTPDLGPQVETLYRTLCTLIGDLDAGVRPDSGDNFTHLAGAADVQNALHALERLQACAVRRAVNEAVTNAVKRGCGTDDITLNTTWNDTELKVTVTNRKLRDDVEVIPGAGFGMRSVRDDLRRVGGRLTMRRRKQQTTITIIVEHQNGRRVAGSRDDWAGLVVA